MVQKMVNGQIKNLQDFNVGGIKVYSSAKIGNDGLKCSKNTSESNHFSQAEEHEESNTKCLTEMNLF